MYIHGQVDISTALSYHFPEIFKLFSHSWGWKGSEMDQQVDEIE